jgi:hypothetical protein
VLRLCSWRRPGDAKSPGKKVRRQNQAFPALTRVSIPPAPGCGRSSELWGRPHGKPCLWRPKKRYQSTQTLRTRKRYQETLRLVVSSLYVLTTHRVGLETSPAEGRFSHSWSRSASAKLSQLTIVVTLSCLRQALASPRRDRGGQRESRNGISKRRILSMSDPISPFLTILTRTVFNIYLAHLCPIKTLGLMREICGFQRR